MQTSDSNPTVKSHPVEDVLARLMPAAISAQGQRGIESMLDGLTASCPAWPVERARHRSRKWIWSGGIAASIAAISVAAAQINDHRYRLVGSPTTYEQQLGSEGIHEDAEGRLMEAVRLRIVEEGRYKDILSGRLITLTNIQEETIFLPLADLSI
ncbi:MAG: hypothetical protein FJ385_06720 [Verrucomicrobia bacterium]|nr:hypothetical protein [Verrucomicrobiota bacterium]